MAMTDEDRATFAAAAPVYVEPAEDGTWRLLSTETGEALSVEHATAKKALAAAVESGALDAALGAKRAVLHTDGEPDGAWRWLDATAEEDKPTAYGDEPNEKVRIVERTCWELAADLNSCAKPAPINGGGAEAGFEPSLPHGDAYTGDGAHKANGWAHAGAVVYEADGRPHLYFWSELIESIAKEVDRGRLAFGSVYFAFSGVDLDDNFAALDAELISHALTNDPAVKTLAPGSARTVTRAGKRLACRSAWRTFMSNENDTQITAEQTEALLSTLGDKTKSATERSAAFERLRAVRGQIADAANAVAGALGITPADMEANPWALSDAVFDLGAALRAEKRIEANGGAPAPAPEPTGGDMAAQRKTAARAVEGVEDDQVEPMLARFVDLGRTVLGKPDTDPAGVLEELESRAEEIGAALGTDTPPDDGAAEGEDETMTEEQRAAAAMSRGAIARERAKRQAAEKERDEAKSRVTRFETRDWLAESLREIKKSLPQERFDRWVDIALESGRSVVEEMLENLNAPPSGEHPMSRAAQRGPAPESLVAATNALLSEARAAMREERGDDEPIPAHLVVARAERMARARFPELAAG